MGCGTKEPKITQLCLAAIQRLMSHEVVSEVGWRFYLNPISSLHGEEWSTIAIYCEVGLGKQSNLKIKLAFKIKYISLSYLSSKKAYFRGTGADFSIKPIFSVRIVI